jgi:hypothetical protein
VTAGGRSGGWAARRAGRRGSDPAPGTTTIGTSGCGSSTGTVGVGSSSIDAEPAANTTAVGTELSPTSIATINA